jgi:hypothetical protein
MDSKRNMSLAERAGWGLAAAALLALGVLWRLDRTRVWEIPRWEDSGLVVLRAAEPGLARTGDACGVEGTSREDGARIPVETWAVAVNPRCALCRGSLAHGLALRWAAHAPVRLAVLIVDTKRRPSAATVATLTADELRWDSTGTWRHRWGHRAYGELLCFDRSGRFVRTLAPLVDSLAARRMLRLAESLRRGGGS